MDSSTKRRPSFEESNTLIQMDDSRLFGIITAVIVIIITLVLFAIWRYKRSARRGVLVLGLCDSGKTLIFSRLLHNRFVQTQTSVKENSGNYMVKGGFLRIVDIPGHERLRTQFFDQFKSLSRGIIYVIDSVNFQKEINDVAEFLYCILSDSVVASNSPPVLILCNKQDQPLAKGCKVIQSYLEKEINTLRVTKSSQLQSTNDTRSTNTFLGKKGKSFEFSHLLPMKVDFAECIAVINDNEKSHDLDSVKEWLKNIA